MHHAQQFFSFRPRRFVLKLLSLGVLLLVLAACDTPSANHQTQPTSVPLPPLPAIGTLPLAAEGAQALGPLSPESRLQLSIGLDTNRQALADDLAALYDPTSPHFGQFLTPDQVAARYGAPQGDVDKVTAFLSAQGFQIGSVSALRDSISVSATVAQIAATFHLVLQSFQQHGATFFGPTGQVSLPPQMQPLITSILGLSNFAQPGPSAGRASLPLTDADGSSGQAASGAQAACPQFHVLIPPKKVAAAYHYAEIYQAGYTGKGIKIGEIEFNDHVSEQDITAFLACTTGGTLHRQVVPVDGGAQQFTDDATFEATQDFEELSAMAPDAQLLEYQTPSCSSADVTCLASGGHTWPQAFYDAINQVAREKRVQVASMSWLTLEDALTPNELSMLGQATQRLAAEGIPFATAAGDCGAFGDSSFGRPSTYGTPSILFPTDDPYALSVGGTTLATDDQGHRTSEIAWSDANPDKTNCANTWGTGGGLSKYYKQPSWQQGPGVKNSASTGYREAPDVAAIAIHLPGFYQGQWYGVYGTSFAAPIWAAGLSLVAQGLQSHHKSPLLGSTPTFYRLATHSGKLHPYYDVTQGTDLYYQCTSGWDYPTGWGAPNLLDFGKALGAF